MATQGAFKQPFQESDAPGPEDPKHWMHRTYASNWAIFGLALYGLVVLGLMVWIILDEFPKFLVAQGVGAALGSTPTAEELARAANARAAWEVAVLKLVLSFGALGGLLHLLSSLGRFVGGRRLERSWGLFYLLRPPVGAALGFFVYFVLRMSAMGQETGIEIPAVNVYGVLAFSALAGMFSRQATEKLAEVFDVLFQKTKQGIEERGIDDLAGKHVRMENEDQAGEAGQPGVRADEGEDGRAGRETTEEPPGASGPGNETEEGGAAEQSAERGGVAQSGDVARGEGREEAGDGGESGTDAPGELATDVDKGREAESVEAEENRAGSGGG